MMFFDVLSRFGSRITCVAGSLVSAVSIFASSYSSSFTAILLTYGVVGGVVVGVPRLRHRARQVRHQTSQARPGAASLQ